MTRIPERWVPGSDAPPRAAARPCTPDARMHSFARRVCFAGAEARRQAEAAGAADPKELRYGG